MRIPLLVDASETPATDGPLLSTIGTQVLIVIGAPPGKGAATGAGVA